MCKVDDLDESDFEDMENDHDIEENKNVTKVDTGDLDSEDDNVDDEKSDKETKSDMENDHNIEENKNVTEVDTGDLDFKDDIVDDEKSEEEKKSDMENYHNIEENKNELNKECEYKAYDGNVISVSL